jgi:hypothetical protein
MSKVNLREERESRNISIKDVSNKAKIPAQYIEALETGIVPQKLRGPILLSYKKKYLKFLRLPIDSKLRFKTKNRNLPSSTSGRYRTKTILTTTTNGIKQPSTLQSMAIGFTIAVICIATLKLISTVLDTQSQALDTQSQAPKKVEIMKQKSAITQVKEPEKNTATTSWLDSFFQTTVTDAHAAEKKDQGEAAVVPEGGRLSITAREKTKVRMYCDSSLKYTGFLQKGKDYTQQCTFQEDASIWVEDVSRVKIAFNSRYIRPMGPQDAARTLKFFR